MPRLSLVHCKSWIPLITHSDEAHGHLADWNSITVCIQLGPRGVRLSGFSCCCCLSGARSVASAVVQQPDVGEAGWHQPCAERQGPGLYLDPGYIFQGTEEGRPKFLVFNYRAAVAKDTLSTVVWRRTVKQPQERCHCLVLVLKLGRFPPTTSSLFDVFEIWRAQLK